MKISKLTVLICCMFCSSQTTFSMRRVKSTSDLPPLENVTEKTVADTVSEPITPLLPLAPRAHPTRSSHPSLRRTSRIKAPSPLSRSSSTNDIFDTTEPEKISSQGPNIFLSIINTIPGTVTIRTTYNPVEQAEEVVPLIFNQKITYGPQAIRDIYRLKEYRRGREKRLFTLTSIQFIDPGTDTVLQEITGEKLASTNTFIGINLQPHTKKIDRPHKKYFSQQSSTESTKAPKGLPRPRATRTRGFHVSPGQSRSSSPSVVSPSQNQLIIQSAQPFATLPPRPTSDIARTPYHVSPIPTSRTSLTPIIDLSDLPTEMPSDDETGSI